MPRTVKPPKIAGYQHLELIGQGGFADVFLFRQERPARQVAIKVLVEELVDGPVVARFEAEANVMAQLSSHPSIVSIYQADVTADGRPYLVMEYCPQPNLALRCRTAPLPLPEALEIAIRVSGAVETAHRADVIHRDIKPHNILVDAYDQPKLTDFGIASAADSGPEAGGMSVPWSPPEMFGDHPPRDPRSDVWSLGATLFHLLAGRSPFEAVGGNNDNHTLMSRIERQAPSPLNRGDVGPRLTEVLNRSMSKSPADRYPSAIAFARALQDVQIGLHITPSRIDVLDSSTTPVRELDDARTSIQPILVIRQSVEAAPASLVTSAPISKDGVLPARSDDTVHRTAVPSAGSSRYVEDTLARAPSRPTDEAVAPTPLAAAPLPVARPAPSDTVNRRSTAGDDVGTAIPTVDGHPPRRRLAIGAAAAGVLVAVLAIAFAVSRPESDPEPTGLGDEPPANAVAPVAPAPISGQRAVINGDRAVFTWSSADALPTDSYRWAETTNGSPGDLQETTETRVVLPLGESGITCIVVRVLRGGSLSLPVEWCAR